MKLRTVLMGAAIALAFLIGGCDAAQSDADGVDLVGVKLGMTVEEARRAILDYNPDLLIRPPGEKYIQYQVVNEMRRTEPFLSYIFAQTGKKQRDDIYVYFSSPPSEPRVVAVHRNHSHFDPPILRETYRNALIEKYGEPSATQSSKFVADAQNSIKLQWHIGDGKVQCAAVRDGGYEIEGQFGEIDGNTIVAGNVLKSITDIDTGRFHNPEVRDPSDCAILVTYMLNQDPLSNAVGKLVDVAAAAKSEQETQKWIDELIRQGEAEIRGSKAKPRL